MAVFCFHLLLMIYIPFELFSSPVKSRFLYSYHRPFIGALSHHSSLPPVHMPVVYISVFSSSLNLLDVVFSRILFHGPEVQIQPQIK
jgi:hypothetical protein